jgi:uncharacterized protein with HEPN domain
LNFNVPQLCCGVFYFGVDYKIVWEVVRKRLPEIKPIIQKILEEMEE